MIEHLTPDLWAAANRQTVCKALAEFSHERLLTPSRRDGSYVVHSDDGSVEYRFTASIRALDHW
jgi:siderophore synthetase component